MKFDKQPRENKDTAKFLLQTIHKYRRNYGLDLDKHSSFLMNIPYAYKAAWADHCLCTYQVWLDYQFYLFQKEHNYMLGSIRAYDSSVAYLLNVWNLSKGIYRFAPNFNAYLPKLDLRKKIATYCLRKLPEWCVYVETPTWNLCGLEPNGFLALIDWHPQDGFLLRLLIDLPGHFAQMDIALDGKLTYEQVIDEEISHIMPRSMFGINEATFKNPIEIDTKMFYREGLSYILPRLLCICAENSDIKNETNPGQIIRKTPFGTKKGKRGLLSLPTPSIITVGGSFDAQMLTSGSTAKIAFHEINTGTETQLEIAHEAVPTVQQNIDKEFKDNSILSLLEQTFKVSQEQLELYEATIKKLESENDLITAEVLESFDKITELQTQLRKQDEKFSQLIYSLNRKNSSYSDTRLLKESEYLSILKKVSIEGEWSARDALEMLNLYAKNRVRILPSAWNSADNINQTYQYGKKLSKLLFMLVTDYLNIYLEKGDSEARKVFGSIYSAQESESVMRSDLAKTRVFSGYEMKKHLRIGNSERLYFEVDVDEKIIVIGYCGKHLPIISR